MAGKRESVAEHAHFEATVHARDCLARAQCKIVEDAAILSQGKLCFRSTINVVKDDFGQSPLHGASQVIYVYDSRRGQSL